MNKLDFPAQVAGVCKDGTARTGVYDSLCRETWLWGVRMNGTPTGNLGGDTTSLL